MDLGSLDVGELAVGAAVALASAGLSAAVTVAVVIRLPVDHFAYDAPRARSSWLVWLARNVAGLLLVAIGIVMALPGIPGQGLLTILMGIMCLDLPGKRRLELRIVRRPAIHRAIDKVRARYGRPPLRLPPASGSVDGPDDAPVDGSASARPEASPSSPAVERDAGASSSAAGGADAGGADAAEDAPGSAGQAAGEAAAMPPAAEVPPGAGAAAASRRDSTR